MSKKELEVIVGENMGCYYREATKQWLRQINDPHTKEYSHLADMTVEVLGTTKAITALIQEAVKEAEQKAWDKIHTQHEPGDVVGSYIIIDRYKNKTGRNNKFHVECVFCGREMVRYSNKFNSKHQDCPQWGSDYLIAEGGSDEL